MSRPPGVATMNHLERCISEELDDLAPIFDELTLWSARFGILMLDHLELRPSERGLDLGCATGFPLLELAARMGPPSEFVGIDTWPRALDVARQKIAHHRVENVEVRLADASALPFESGSFSLITSNLGINNFASPDAVLAEAFRVCRAGGRLAFTTNPVGTMPEAYEAMRQSLREIGVTDVRALDEQERHRGTVESCIELVEAAGFRVRKTVRDRFSMRFATGGALFRHVLTACFLEGWRAALPPGRAIELLRATEKRLDEVAARTGSLETSFQMLYVEAERPSGQ